MRPLFQQQSGTPTAVSRMDSTEENGMFGKRNRKPAAERKIETKALTQAELDALAGGCRSCIGRTGQI